MNSLFSGIALSCLFVIGSVVEANDKSSLYGIDGFVDVRVGARTRNDVLQKDSSIGEFRLQLETEKEYADATLNIVIDFLLDPVLDIYAPNFESGEGMIDPRLFNVVFSIADNVDIKLGRQVLTWGTGDLIFINDLFAKDFKSFFIGRDDEYLKAPTDAIKVSVFFSNVNLDIVYTPKFNADRFIDGSRISFYDRSSGAFRGSLDPLTVDRPDDWFIDDELALRLYRSISGVEAALYYYTGFWKSPAGFDLLSQRGLFPELEVLGGSLRSSLVAGLANLEFGYYKSHKTAKNNPFSRNSEFRLLLGYEKEIAHELTAGIQYSVERKLDYDDYLQSLPANSIKDDKTRSIATVRLTKLMLRQDLKLSLFNFYSSSDEDGFLRLNASYKLSDELKIEGGVNHFYGKESYTFFAQFKNTSNIYSAVRYEF